MSLDLSSFEKAVASLGRAYVRAQETPEDEELRDACIQRFEYSFELSWKMLKRQLELEVPTPSEVREYSYKDIFRTGGVRGLVKDVEAWFRYRELRNISSHTYDEEKAREVYGALGSFIIDAEALLSTLKGR